MTADERDPILERLREVDPARVESGDEPLVRAGVKRRVESALRPPDRGRRTRRAGLVVAGAGVLAVVVAIMFGGGGGGGLAPGPEPALAIEKAPNSVTLTIDDPAAGADEMNRELETAGIDRVRVVSVPGSPNHAGTWAGSIDIGADCEDAPVRAGYGIRIPYRVIDTAPAPGQGFVDLELPRGPTGSGHAPHAVERIESSMRRRSCAASRSRMR